MIGRTHRLRGRFIVACFCLVRLLPLFALGWGGRLVAAGAALPTPTVEVTQVAVGGARRSVSLNAARVGDIVGIVAPGGLVAGTGWRHLVWVRRPALTSATPPEDGSGLGAAYAGWNLDGWGNPHAAATAFRVDLINQLPVDLGRRAPYVHDLASGQPVPTRAVDFVLDAPGAWTIYTEVVDGTGASVAVSARVTVTVLPAPLAGDVAELTYPYGRDDRFVGVFWSAGQAHRLWSSWRVAYQQNYAATWAVNWRLMWQPSPYFRRVDGGWLRPEPAADSPWQAFWSGHEVYALVPDGQGGSAFTHDITSRAFAERAAVRLMDVGVDFAIVDYTNQFLEEREEVLPAVDHLAQAFEAVAQRAPSRQRVRLCAVVPANVTSGDWGGNGGFVPVAIARFNAKLTTLYERYARHEAAWFHLEDDRGVRKPLLLLWIGAGGEDAADGTLSAAKLAALKLADGRALTEAFTVRWVGAYLANNSRFVTGTGYAVSGTEGTVRGAYARPKIWSYHESHPAAATLAPGGDAVEAITVQPVATGGDRFGRAWVTNWPAGQGYHYETPATSDPVSAAGYGKVWRDALAAARALRPRFLLTTWLEFGSENDEPRPEMAVTVMDNNKFGTYFGDEFRQAVRLFKYRAPTAWLDVLATEGETLWLRDAAAGTVPRFRLHETVRLQGWVTPNVATAFAGGSVKVYVDHRLAGTAVVGGEWSGATRWTYDLPLGHAGLGEHVVQIVVEDGVGGASHAGVQLRGESPRNFLAFTVLAAAMPTARDP